MSLTWCNLQPDLVQVNLGEREIFTDLTSNLVSVLIS